MPQLLTAGWARAHLPPRPADGHKGTFGSLTILAGCAHYRGAAALAAEGALRSGAGLVRLASTEKVCAAVAARLPGCILQPLPEDDQGNIACSTAALVSAPDPSAFLLGCGLGKASSVASLVTGVMAEAKCPVLLDADALNLLAGHMDTGMDAAARENGLAALCAFAPPLVLTPHPGEMARLCGKPLEEVLQNPAGAAAAFARKYQCTVVLKCHETHIVSASGEAWINREAGNPGMAKGGSGDVLAGLIAGLMAQGMEPALAAALGVWLHAAAGDEASRRHGQAGMLPADLPACLGAVWLSLQA